MSEPREEVQIFAGIIAVLLALLALLLGSGGGGAQETED